MSRQSSRGNPYHYPKGHPRGGQFAPKGFAGAAAVACGHYFSDKAAFDAYAETDEFKDAHRKFYNKNRTMERFSKTEASEAQVRLAESIEKKLGRPTPKGGTAREYEDYIARNIGDYGSASEDQARFIKKLEEEHGITLATDDRHGTTAGSYIGHCTKAAALLDERNWQEHEDGTIHCKALKWNEDGTPDLRKDGVQKSSDTGYRLVPVRINGESGYIVERKQPVGEINGKKVETYMPVDSDGTKSFVKKKGMKEAMKRASRNELKRHVDSGRSATKRSPSKIRKTVRNFEAMGESSNWVNKHGGLEFARSFDKNNSYKYRIEQGTTGFHVYREVTTTHTRSEYDPEKGIMVTRMFSTTRQEWAATGCKSIDDAIHLARMHEAEAICDKRIKKKPSKKKNPTEADKRKAATYEKEIKRWIAKGEIKSKHEYEHLLDPVKDFLKS